MFLALNWPTLLGQTTNKVAPGAPGSDAHWPSAAKNGFGTAHTLESKVWFTLQGGVLTEVFYPRLDVPNTQVLQMVVCTQGVCRAESDDTVHKIRVLDSRALSFRQINTAPNDAYTITKTYSSDPQRPTVLIDVSFTARNPGSYEVYVYFDPSLNNSGMHDTAWTSGDALLAADQDVASALISKPRFQELNNGYLGTSDGLLQLRRSGRIIDQYQRADNGNVVQVARVGEPRAFTLVLGFGKNAAEALRNARASLGKGFARSRREYESGWHTYVNSLPTTKPKYRRQFNIAAMVLKALEDKTYRGAMIASPSIPWGGGPNANEPVISGYHGVWSRDLYHVATAFLTLGDQESANRALDYLFNVQQKPDGSFPQNSWVDGRPIGSGLQMDQIALPLVLAYQLRRTDRDTWLRHVKPAADFIVSKGPFTEQERWEEKAGYSPSTIAAEIAGLVCAARIATLNRDRRAAAEYLRHADEWENKINNWTATNSGRLVPGCYYLRISENDDPNDGAKIEINSGGGTYDEREIVDAGFLELVRLGIKSARDPLVVKSLALVDSSLRVQTPAGPAWYRYNHDAYGETPNGRNYDGRTGVGRLWTLLTGERGEYELARGDARAARQHLDAMMGFANQGLMIPEQIWDRRESPNPDFRFGAGTGSATPLAWSMAQFIRLVMNIETGHNGETPAIVHERYRKKSTKP